MYLAESKAVLGSHAQAHVLTALLATNLPPPCAKGDVLLSLGALLEATCGAYTTPPSAEVGNLFKVVVRFC